MLICVLNCFGAFDETQSSWQDGPGEEGPVTSWSAYFLSSENMNWNNSESSIYLDYAENCPEHVIDASAGAPYSVVSINMDSDTDIDLLVTSWSDDIVAWYRNEGNGQSWTLVEIAAQFDGANCARPCDVNNDGYMDVIASAYYADSLFWFESDSSEYLWIPHPIDRIENPGEIEPVIMGDSVHLLVCESETGILHNYVSSIDTDSITWEHFQIPGEYPGISSIDITDIDVDGDLDIVLAEYNGGRIIYLECLNWFDEFEEHVIDSLIFHPVCVRLGNIDGDALELPDIAVCSYDNDAVYWYENTEHGACWYKHTVTEDLWGASGLCICDIATDEDDWLNIVAAGRNDSEVRWYEYSGEKEWSEYLIGELDGASALCAAEIDAVSGLEIVGAAGVGEAIKYWSPGFVCDEGELVSTILDAQSEQQWSNISWIADCPVDSILIIQVRSSDDWENMGSWSEELYEPTELYGILADTTRYFQYRILMNSPDSVQTSVLHEITVSWDDLSIDETSSEEVPVQFLSITSPNPSHNSIEFSVTALQQASIRLLDISGRVVEEFTVPDSGTYIFKTENLVPGMYFLQTDMKDIQTNRIVIIN
jgi:hypothetical protein